MVLLGKGEGVNIRLSVSSLDGMQQPCRPIYQHNYGFVVVLLSSGAFIPGCPVQPVLLRFLNDSVRKRFCLLFCYLLLIFLPDGCGSYYLHIFYCLSLDTFCALNIFLIFPCPGNIFLDLGWPWVVSNIINFDGN